MLICIKEEKFKLSNLQILHEAGADEPIFTLDSFWGLNGILGAVLMREQRACFGLALMSGRRGQALMICFNNLSIEFVSANLHFQVHVPLLKPPRNPLLMLMGVVLTLKGDYTPKVSNI